MILARQFAVVVALAALAVGAGPGVTAAPALEADGTIGLYSDLSGTRTSATFAIGVPRTLYIIATLDGETADGITGAEFSVSGFPDDWQVFVSANPAAVITLGDPFRIVNGAQRANIAFSFCTGATEGQVLLYTAVVIATSVVAPHDLIVVGGNPPTNPNFATPIFTRCNLPEYSKVAAVGGHFQLEQRAPQDLDYSQLPGYNGNRGVEPHQGQPGDMFHFRVVFANSDGVVPAPGSPRLELDANADGDALDPGEGAFTMSSADQDSTLTNGKEYRYDVALGAPPGGRYHYRFAAVDAHGATVPGNATAWHDSLFVTGEWPNLVVRAEDIRVVPGDPAVNTMTGIVARIENRSDRAAHEVRVRIENVFGLIIAERTLASIGPRSTTEMACSWRFTDPGFQPVRVRVDPANTIPESDEADNVASHAVSVGSSSVVVLSGLPPSITVPPLAPFMMNGNAAYAVGAMPHSVVSGAQVVCTPSWDAPQTTRTDAAGNFRAGFTPPAVLGTYRLSFVVRDGARTDSSIVSVQVTSILGQQPPHAANLVLHLEAALGAGCPATVAAIAWSVTNQGDRASEATTVRLLADGVALAGEVALGALAAGATVALDPLEVPVSGSGLRSFTAQIDPDNARREFRKDDNAVAASVVVPPGCLDLAIERAQFTASPFCSSTNVPFVVRVVNRGCVASEAARVACRSGGGEIATAALDALAPGAAAEVSFAEAFELTCHELDFVLDPDGVAGTDCEGGNNTLTASLCVGHCDVPPPPPRPNFGVAACDIHVTNAAPALGEELRFQAWISNAGPGDATLPVIVRFTVDDSVIGGVAVPIDALHPGARVLATSPGVWAADFAHHVVTVAIDPGGQAEPDTLDNIAFRVLPWNLHPQAITRCPNPNSMFSVCAPCPDIPVDIRAVVLNDGLFDCDSVQVEFRDQSHGGAVIGTAVAENVRGGNTCSGVIEPVHATHTFTDGLYHVAAVIDPHNAWPESDETDNTYVQDLNVGCIVTIDLVPTIHFPPGFTPQPGDTVQSVEVQVANRGTGRASAVEARLQLDHVTLCDLQMGDILPGASSTIQCTTPWVVTEPLGEQQLEACADPNNRIFESDETNNCTRRSVSGGPSDLAIYSSSIHITPTNPSAGEPVLIEVGVYNQNDVESTCSLLAEWLSETGYLPITSVTLRVPAGPIYFPNALTVFWQVPSANVGLRFRLLNVAPEDADLSNNTATGTLPWFVVPSEPVTVSDLGAESVTDGVLLHWRAEPRVESFRLERCRAGEVAWMRLPDAVPALSSAHSGRYEVLDRTAEPGAHLEYQIIGRFAGGREEVVGFLAWLYDRTALFALQLHPVRPNPFRPGGAFEFSLPQARQVDLGVFDAAGRRLATLRHGLEGEGQHAVAWDARDATGRRVPAGVYFCRFVSGAFQQTRRVILIR